MHQKGLTRRQLNGRLAIGYRGFVVLYHLACVRDSRLRRSEGRVDQIDVRWIERAVPGETESFLGRDPPADVSEILQVRREGDTQHRNADGDCGQNRCHLWV